MLGLIFIYFIGKYFYDLALEYNRNGWLFGILGIAVYYAGTIIAGILFEITDLIFQIDFFSALPSIVIGIFALPFGLLCCWQVYIYLQKQFEKKALADEGNASTEQYNQ